MSAGRVSRHFQLVSTTDRRTREIAVQMNIS